MSSFIPWKILHLDLSELLPALPAEPDYQGLYLVLWWRNIPLGHRLIPAAQLPIPATQLANLATQIIAPVVGDQLLPQESNDSLAAYFDYRSQILSPDLSSLVTLERPLTRLGERWSTAPTGAAPETVSVIICTRDRPEQLAKCLKSLQGLSELPHEIIVIDNASMTDRTRHLVATIPGVRYLQEPRPGLSVARNTGIRASAGDIVAFTDDDVMVHSDWITRLRQSFQHPKVMAMTGLVIPAALETEAQVAFEIDQGCLSRDYRAKIFDQEFFQATRHMAVPVWLIGAGANMAFRRQIFDLVGYFDERLGAGAAGCSEDSEFWYRVLAEGWVCRYEPTAAVFHHHRQDLDSLRRQMSHYMRGHVAALLIQFARYKHWGNLRRLFFSLPKYYTGILLLGLIQGFGLKHKTYLAEVSGCIAGIKFYLQNGATSQQYPQEVNDEYRNFIE
jgi:GT2 family glycosyltransferase